MKLKVIFAFLLLSSIFMQKGWSQDLEFSQFYAAPSYLNPSMIGFAVEPRFVLNYRHQYPSFEHTFVSVAASYDQHFDKFNSSVGLSVLADRTGGGLYNTYFVNGMYAYQLPLSRNLTLKAGVSVSFMQVHLDWNSLVFNDMINTGSGVPDIGTAEEAPDANNLSRLDLGMGFVTYSKNFYAGLAFKHITRPELTFTNSNDPRNNIHIRTAAHLGYLFYFGPDRFKKPKFYLAPNILMVNQGRHFRLDVGAYLGKGPVFGGLWARHNFNNMDALVFMVGFKKDVVRIGYSYDFTLAPIGTSAGAHEISLSFDFGNTRYAQQRAKSKRSAQCPEIFSN